MERDIQPRELVNLFFTLVHGRLAVLGLAHGQLVRGEGHGTQNKGLLAVQAGRLFLSGGGLLLLGLFLGDLVGIQGHKGFETVHGLLGRQTRLLNGSREELNEREGLEFLFKGLDEVGVQTQEEAGGQVRERQEALEGQRQLVPESIQGSLEMLGVSSSLQRKAEKKKRRTRETHRFSYWFPRTPKRALSSPEGSWAAVLDRNSTQGSAI